MAKVRSKNAVAVWDFTKFVDSDAVSEEIERVRTTLRSNGKKWGFQVEACPSTGRVHIQGRISLNTKQRKLPLHVLEAHWSITQSDNISGERFYAYVCKERTRTHGPFSDRSEPTSQYIPRQYRLTEMRPFQQSVIDHVNGYWRFGDNDRTVNVLINHTGNIGKSVLCHTLRLKHGGVMIPPVNDAEKLIAAVLSKLKGKRLRSPKVIMIDLPRAMAKDKLFGWYNAIEQIKNGWVYDFRYKYQERDFDSPHVWVFTNQTPDSKLISRDRWKLWTVDEDLELVRWTDELDFIEDKEAN